MLNNGTCTGEFPIGVRWFSHSSRRALRGVSASVASRGSWELCAHGVSTSETRRGSSARALTALSCGAQNVRGLSSAPQGATQAVGEDLAVAAAVSARAKRMQARQSLALPVLCGLSNASAVASFKIPLHFHFGDFYTSYCRCIRVAATSSSPAASLTPFARPSRALLAVSPLAYRGAPRRALLSRADGYNIHESASYVQNTERANGAKVTENRIITPEFRAESAEAVARRVGPVPPRSGRDHRGPVRRPARDRPRAAWPPRHAARPPPLSPTSHSIRLHP